MSANQQFNVMLNNGHQTTCRFLTQAGTSWWIKKLQGRPELEISEIGNSRNGIPILGIIAGHGPVKVSITAGAHADEPAGPIAACITAWLMSEPDAAALRNKYTFCICPQVNPDGAEANQAWFAAIPDIETYLKHVKREGPGEDIEFGYPGDGKEALRPENKAVADFLAARGPYNLHCSLHSMGFAEGAWFLIEKSWADRTQPLQSRFKEIAIRHNLGLHDIQRNGEKGFHRIAPGFATTPTSIAMQDYFVKNQDLPTAEKFHFSSMEYAKSLGGNPLAIVSELPNFLIEPKKTDSRLLTQASTPGMSSSDEPAPGETVYEITRDRIKAKLAGGDIPGAVTEAKLAGIKPVPFATHVAAQVEMVLAACEFIAADDLPEVAQRSLSDAT